MLVDIIYVVERIKSYHIICILIKLSNIIYTFYINSMKVNVNEWKDFYQFRIAKTIIFMINFHVNLYNRWGNIVYVCW